MNIAKLDKIISQKRVFIKLHFTKKDG